MRQNRPASVHRRGDSLTSGIRKISFSEDPKVILRTNLPLPPSDYTPKVPSPLTLEYAPPFRVEYKRTISTKAYSDPTARVKFGHRRTQSCTTPGTQANKQDGVKSELRKSPHNRSSTNIVNSREYYAAPAYNEAALLERKVSMRQSHNQTEEVIE